MVQQRVRWADLDAKRVLGVVEGRTREAAMVFLEGMSGPDLVQGVSMDINGAYKSALGESLPDAEITVDKSHVIKRVNELLSLSSNKSLLLALATFVRQAHLT